MQEVVTGLHTSASALHLAIHTLQIQPCHRMLELVRKQPEELQLPRAEVQLSTIPMAQVDTNVKLNSFCGNCGSPLNADSKKFCVKCGAAITDIE